MCIVTLENKMWVAIGEAVEGTPLDSEAFAVATKATRVAFLVMPFVRRYWSVRSCEKKQRKADEKVKIFLKKRPAMTRIVEALMARHQFVPIIRKLQTEETKRMNSFFKESVPGYRQLFLQTCGQSAPASSMDRFLGLGSSGEEIPGFKFLGGLQDKTELRVKLFMSLVCHCLGNDVLKTSPAGLLRDIVPLRYVAYIFATFARYSTASTLQAGSTRKGDECCCHFDTNLRAGYGVQSNVVLQR